MPALSLPAVSLPNRLAVSVPNRSKGVHRLGVFALWAATLLPAVSPCLAQPAATPKPETPVRLPAQPAILKFAFGPADSPAYAGFIRVTDKTAFTPAAGYGWLQGPPSAVRREVPNALYGASVSANATFAAAPFPNERYCAWFVLGDVDSSSQFYNGYYGRDFAVKLPGDAHPLLENKWTADEWWKWHFELQDVEWDDIRSVWDTYVQHQFKSYTVEFTVTGGRVQLNFSGGHPLCCLVVYPKSMEEAAKAAIEKLQADMRAEFDARFAVKLPQAVIAPELITPEADARGFILVGRDAGYYEVEEANATLDPPSAAAAVSNSAPKVGETGWTPETTQKEVSLFAALGQSEARCLAILPLRDIPSAKIAVSDLKGPGDAVFPAGSVEVACQRYRLERNSPPKTGMSPAPQEIVKRDTVRLHAKMPQMVWLRVNVPADAKAGNYVGTVTVTAGEAQASLPLKLKILPIRLDSANYFSRGGFYYPPDMPSLGEERFWRIVENDCKFLSEYEMSCPQGIPLLGDALTRDGLPNPKFVAAMDRFTALYHKYNFAGPIAPFMFGFLPDINPPSDPAKRDQPIPEKARKETTNYLVTLKKLEKEHGWPEIVVYSSDELSNGGGAGVKWAEKYVTMLNEIKKQVPGGFRICASMNGMPEYNMSKMLDCPMPNGGMPLTQDWIDEIHAAGHELWLYNIGPPRFTYGYYIWRTRATAHFNWHFDDRPFMFERYDPFVTRSYYFVGIPTRDCTRLPMPTLELWRKGVCDLKYLVTLEKAIAANPNKPESRAAREWLHWLHDHVQVGLYHYGAVGSWDPAVYDQLRWQVAEQILKVQGQNMP